MKMKLVILVVIVILILSTGGIISEFASDSKDDAVDKTDDNSTVDDDNPMTNLEVYGDGEVMVTFEVHVPAWTPGEDRIYVMFDGYSHDPGGGVPMVEVEPDTWSTMFKAPSKQVMKYKYNRNNAGYTTAEEFAPDSPDTWREEDVDSKSVKINDTVRKWRWLSEKPPEVSLSDFTPDDLPVRNESFIIGIFMLDYYSPAFTEFIPSTFDRIKEKGFEYIGIAYAPSFFIGGNPLKFSREPLNTYTDEQLNFTIKEARKQGLKIILSAGVETDPGSFDLIEPEFIKPQPDEWYRQLAREWNDVMVETAGFCEKNEIEIFTPSDQWPFWGDKSEPQKVMLNKLINNAYKNLSGVYNGKISTDYYNEDPAFDYYKHLDWLGDKWWWPLAGENETNFADMKARAENIINETYKPRYQRYNKPIFLQQLAYSSYDGSAGGNGISTEGSEVAEWYPYNDAYPADFQEQADALEAVFQAIYDDTMFAGAVSFGYGYWDLYDKGPGVRSKPAENVWVKWNQINQ